MHQFKHVAFLFFCLLWSACSPVLKQAWLDPGTILAVPADSLAKITRATGLYQSCLDWEDYVPDPAYMNHLPMRTVLVNVHFMNSTSKAHNYDGEAGRKEARDMIYHVNEMMKYNKKMHLPLGNETPVLPAMIQYELSPQPGVEGDDGIYFHYDDELFFMVTRGKDRNLTDRRGIDKYKIRDSVLNVFIMPHHPDSVASETYKPYGSGIALGTAVKLCGLFENGLSTWYLKGTFAHEFAHVLGLAHSWSGYDGCDDTPKHSNCYNHTDTPPCDKEVSNNMMDYNTWQEALTPCQIAKMHITMSNYNTNVRKIVKPDWCVYDTSATIIITDTIVWGGSKDLAGDIIIAEGGHLTIKCRVSLAEGASIIVKKGGTLFLDNAWLHNSCGGTWNGIQIETLGKSVPNIQKTGEVRIENIVHPNIRENDTKP